MKISLTTNCPGSRVGTYTEELIVAKFEIKHGVLVLYKQRGGSYMQDMHRVLAPGRWLDCRRLRE